MGLVPCEVFLGFEETGQSKIFPNAALGYWKVVVERPLEEICADIGALEKESEGLPAEIIGEAKA